MVYKKWAILLLTGMITSIALGQSSEPAAPLSQVTFQLSAEQWVTTQTAKVTIALDASLTKDQIAKAQTNIQQALKKIAPQGNWYITVFSLSPTKANLEQLHAEAEARLPESAMQGLRDKTQKLSKEGQTYTVEDIAYTPSLAEISAAQAKLRTQIYQQAKDEMTRLNSVYPSAGYRLYSIQFTGVLTQPGPVMMAKTNSMTVGRETPNLAVSQNLTVDATVVLAAQVH